MKFWKKLAYWEKGSLMAVVLNVLALIIYFIWVFSLPSSVSEGAGWLLVYGILFLPSILVSFIIGALIGLIVEKVKKK